MTENETHSASEYDPMTVGRVADLAGVTVRTLHHWDRIGLVVPSGRSWAEYRLYDADDVARMHRVLVYRELGLPLAEIGRMLDDPDIDPREHLQRQRDLLAEKIRRLQRTAHAVDEMIERTTTMNANNTTNVTISPEEQKRIFGTDWDPGYQDEARERWGDTPQWAQSVERTASYTADDWQEVKDETDALNAALGDAMRRGVEPGSSEADALAERHLATVTRHYDCTHSMQVILARIYTEDPRFTATYDKVAPGLATWLRAIIEENARAHGVDPATAEWE